MMIHLFHEAGSGPYARLHCGHKVMRAVIGRNGLTTRKQEGDLCTPVGTFALRQVYFRADRLPAPRTSLPLAALSPHDGWCDDPHSPLYNQLVRLPCPDRHEELWKADSIYDLIVVIGYNDDPARPGAGSAIFMHLQRPNLSPTEGCVALEKADLLHVLQAGAKAITIHP